LKEVAEPVVAVALVWEKFESLIMKNEDVLIINEGETAGKMGVKIKLIDMPNMTDFTYHSRSGFIYKALSQLDFNE
jgi:hypothetical protein